MIVWSSYLHNGNFHSIMVYYIESGMGSFLQLKWDLVKIFIERYQEDSCIFFTFHIGNTTVHHHLS